MKTRQLLLSDFIFMGSVSNCLYVQTFLAPLNYAFSKKKDAIMATMSLSRAQKLG